MTLEAMEQLLITDALRRNGENRQQAAKELGINVSTLFRKLKTLKVAGAPPRPSQSAKR